MTHPFVKQSTVSSVSSIEIHVSLYQKDSTFLLVKNIYDSVTLLKLQKYFIFPLLATPLFYISQKLVFN